MGAKMFMRVITLVVLAYMSVLANSVGGQWILTHSLEKGKKRTDMSHVSMKSGKFVIEGYEFGTYRYDSSKQIYTLKSQEKSLKGKYKVSFDGDVMMLEKAPLTLYFLKYDKQKTLEANANSGLTGSWTVASDDGAEHILFLGNDGTFKHTKSYDGMRDTTSGLWIADAQNKKLICAARRFMLAGESELLSVAQNSMTLRHEKQTYTLTKQKQTTPTTLNFSEDDFAENMSQDPLPEAWRDLEMMASGLKKIGSLSYKVGRYNPDVQSFSYQEITIDVEASQQKPSIMFSYKTEDAGQFAQRYRARMQDETNGFFPEEELYYFRIVGEEQLKLEIGEFKTLVIEGMQGYDKVKLWMMVDRPGIYAKKIVQKEDPFGEMIYEQTLLTGASTK